MRFHFLLWSLVCVGMCIGLVAGCSRAARKAGEDTVARQQAVVTRAESGATSVELITVPSTEGSRSADAVPTISADPALLVGTKDDVIPSLVTPLGGNRYQRIRLVRVGEKYPLRRREEVLSLTRDGVTVVSSVEMVADHVLVSLDRAQPVDVLTITKATGCQLRATIGKDGPVLLSFPYLAHGDYSAMMGRISAQAGIRAAESDWTVHGIGTPNDSGFAQLWGMNNLGQTGGTVDADIDAPEAWNIHTGSKSVIVGIIDTGIDETHPDLAANIWTNPGESGLDQTGNPKATNGIDDDGDGYIDDVHGWNFVGQNNNAHDDHYHGTHCAGTIGGIGNNGSGVAGVCWKVSLVPLKFLSASGSGVTSDAVAAQLYANAIGCDLTSNSWGGGGFSQALKDAIDAAGASGKLFVAAAGNDGVDNDVSPHYPSSFDCANIIAVAATDHTDALASFSCFGATSVDLGAPGVNIYSCQPGNLYQLLSGTSMATPHVAGACALLKSANPSLSGSQIKAAILGNVDPISALSGKTATGGRLNVYRALLSVSGTVITPGTITITENGNGDGLLNPGEQAIITIPLASSGAVAATNLIGTITTTDPAVSLEAATAMYGDVIPGQSATGSIPFRLRLAPGTPTPHTVSLTLQATANVSDAWSFPVSVTYVTSTTITGTVTRLGTGNPVSSATVTWTSTVSGAPASGSTLTSAAGQYQAIVGDGTYLVSSTAPGLNAATPVTVAVPPSAVVNFVLGQAQLVVTPTALSLTETQPSKAFTIANPGDAPLMYSATVPAAPTMSGMWHVTSYRTSTGTGSSWYFGDETTKNYNTGARVSGALVFAQVTIPSGSPILTYDSWRIVEGGTSFDQSLIQISTDSGLTWTALTLDAPSSVARRDGLVTQHPAATATWTTVQQLTDVTGVWVPASVSLSAYAGQQVAIRFYFDSIDSIANSTEGWYIDNAKIGSVSLDTWLAVSSVSGQVAPGGLATISALANMSALDAGTRTAQIAITSNAIVNSNAQVTVTAAKTGGPALALQAAGFSDTTSSPANGDGDGVAEPGETIAIYPAWKNVGTGDSSSITTTVSSPNAAVSVVTATVQTPPIAMGQTLVPSAPLSVVISGGIANNTTVPLTYVATDSQGASWTGTVNLVVKWSSRLSGTAHTGLGSPLAGVTITAGAASATTAVDGTYAINGLSAGTVPVTAAKTGYTSVATSVTTPPNGNWDPVFTTPGVTVSPTAVTLSGAPGSTPSTTVVVSNPGDAALTFSIPQSSTAVPATTGLWHQSSFRTVGGVPSWYYGDEAKRNFDTPGVANSGTLTFTNITVPAGTPTMSWQQWRQAEASTSYDKSLILASTDGVTWTTLYQTVSTAATWETVSTSLTAFAGKTIQVRFSFDTVDSAANTMEGWYLSDFRVNSSPMGSSWLSVSPLTGTVAPGSSMSLQVTGSTAGLSADVYTSAFTLTTNVPSTPAVTIPVSMTIISPATCSIGTPTVIDSGAAPIVGDGDGVAEPGETISWSVPVNNTGTSAASAVTATLTSASPYLAFPATQSFATIAGKSSVQANLPIVISQNCPDNTAIPVTCTITAANGGPWTSTVNLLVKWDCRIFGYVTAVSTGAKLSGALITAGTGSAYSDATGFFSIKGLPAGVTPIAMTLTNYITISGTVNLPTDTNWNPVTGTRDITAQPATLTQTVLRGQSGSAVLTITGSGSVMTTWSIASAPSWLTFSMPGSSAAPGSSTAVTATFTTGALTNGVYSGQVQITTNGTVGSSYKYVQASLTVKSANAPTAAPITASINEDLPTGVQLLGADADGDTLTYTILTQPLHGTVTVNGSGLALVTPSSHYHGADSFTYRVSDGWDTSATATVALTVVHVNHAPTAWPTVIHVAPNVTSTFTLPVSDVDADPLSCSLVTPAHIGTMAVAGIGATYTPPTGFSGQDVCTIIASDGVAQSAAVQVIISVTDTPSQDSWPTLGNGPDHRGAVNGSLGSFSVTPEWKRDFGYPVHQVAIGGGRVFYTSRTYFGVTRAGSVDATTGVDLWQHDFANANTLNPPTYDSGSVYLQRGNHASDSQLWRLDATTGATIWQAPSQEQWEHHQAPTVVGDRVWVNGGYYGGVYGFDRNTGTQLFFRALAQYDQWTPTLVGNSLMTWAGQTLSAVDPQSGSVQWSQNVVVGSGSYSQYCSVIADTQRAYVLGSSTSNPGPPTIYAFDLTTHAQVWSRTGTYRGMPALADGHLFAYTTAGIDQLDASTGVVEFTYAMTGGSSSSADTSVQPIVTTDAVIGSTALGTSVFARGDAVARKTIIEGGHLSLVGSRLFVANAKLNAYRIGNHAPVVAARTVTTIEDSAVSLTLWANDLDDQLVTWSVSTAPANGTATILNDVLTYTPNAGFAGSTDTVWVQATDGTDMSVPAAVVITVQAKPIADPIVLSTVEGTAVPMTLHGSSPRSPTVSYQLTSQPQHGSLDATALPYVLYTPQGGFVGTDSWTYAVTDGVATSHMATITVTVLARPVADPVLATTSEGASVSLTLHGVSPRQVAVTYQMTTQPAHGVLDTASGPLVNYTPALGFFGTDTWTYIVTDGVATSYPATVTITVNARPVADAISVTTPEGDAVTVSLHGVSPRVPVVTYQVLTQPVHGTLDLTALPQVMYTPQSGFVGGDSWTYSVSDGVATSRIATVTVAIIARPTAQSATSSTPRAAALSITLTGASPRNLPLSYAISGAPSHGTLSGTWPTGTYTPAPDFVGTDAWSFTVSDGLATSRSAIVTITVQPGLPVGWTNADIGVTGLAGSTIQNPSTGDLIGTGAGLGLSGTADSGQCATAPGGGDVDIIAKLPLPTTTSANARVGIMIRDSLDPSARSVFVGVSGAKKVIWSRRTTAASAATTSSYAITALSWVKLSRRGNVITASRSTDGSTWVSLGTSTIGFADQVLYGSLIASGTTGVGLPATVGQYIKVMPSVSAPGPMSLNFQAGTDPAPIIGGETWSIADGAAFGARWNGMQYGCTAVTTSTYKRSSTLSLDARYDTGVAAPTTTNFEVSVPNGSYKVTVCVGDPSSTSGKLYPEVEGVRVATGVATSAARWFTGTVTVAVTDGRLTLSSGSGATATRWAWLQIVPVPAGNG